MDTKKEKNVSKVVKETDDYALSRVKPSSKSPTWKIILIQLGSLACIPQFMLGAQLGYGMSMKDAFYAVVVGSLILQFISIGIGIAGQQEGLTTSLLSKWTGFGSLGSGVLSLLFAISMVGFFGIQNSIFAQGIVQMLDKPQYFLITSIITGLAVTFIVIVGLKGLGWTATIAVPGFLLLIGICAFQMLRSHSLIHLATMSAPGKPLSFTTGVTLVTGSFIMGCIMMPDFTRYVKTPKDVCWIAVIGVFVGEICTNMISVLLAHAIGTSKIMPIIYHLSGAFGTFLVILSAVKVNDSNLYSSSLDIVNFVKQFIHLNLNRGAVTFIVGVLGTILSITGILNKFAPFLTLLGTVFPPVAGIMFIDYFILKRSRNELYKSRINGSLPKQSETFNPVTIVAWIIGSLSGKFMTIGIPSINSIIIAAIIYYIGIKLFYRKSSEVKGE